MRIKLEEEFKTREYLHRIGMIKAYLMNKYIKNEKGKRGAIFPIHILEEHASDYSNKIIQSIKGTEKFNDLYEEAWSTLSDKIPEHTKFSMPY